MKKIKNKKNKPELLKKIITINLVLIIISSILATLFIITQLLLPLILESFINEVELMKAGYAKNIIKIASTYISISIIGYILSILKDYYKQKVSWKITDCIRIEVFKKILTYNQEFYNKYNVGELIERTKNDIEIIENFILKTSMEFFINAMLLCGIIVILIGKNTILGMIFLVYIVITFICLNNCKNKGFESVNQEREMQSLTLGFSSELYEMRREINILGKAPVVLEQMYERLKKRLPLRVATQKYYYRFWVITLAFLALANILSLLVGNIFYSMNLISLGLVYLTYSYSTKLKTPMEDFQSHLSNFIAAKISWSRLDQILDFENSKNHMPFNEIITKDKIQIRVENLNYSYGDKHVLKNICLDLSSGEKVGVIGPSGIGKSTLFKLICKIYECGENQIFINGHDINFISRNEMRDKFVYITASEQIFNASLKDNLTMFNSHINTSEIVKMIEVYKLKQYFTFLQNCNIYDVLKQNIISLNLSAGEKQLINLCRLLFCKKLCYVFDEAAANIDEIIEKSYFAILDKIVGNSLLIIISHNVERLEDCTSKLVFSENKFCKITK